MFSVSVVKSLVLFLLLLTFFHFIHNLAHANIIIYYVKTTGIKKAKLSITSSHNINPGLKFA